MPILNLKPCLFAAAVLVPAFTAGLAYADEVRLHGATTVVDRVINPHKSAVEKSTGHTLAIVGNATGRGLVDLMDGKCDASMVSEPMDIAIQAAKRHGIKMPMLK